MLLACMLCGGFSGSISQILRRSAFACAPSAACSPEPVCNPLNNPCGGNAAKFWRDGPTLIDPISAVLCFSFCSRCTTVTVPSRAQTL